MREVEYVNLGHWIDLAVHLLAQKDMPSSCSININFADIENREKILSYQLPLILETLLI